MFLEENKLDNPVWHSLTETHKYFIIDNDGIKFYQPDYCPFGGFINLEKTLMGIDIYSTLIQNFYLVGKRPIYSSKLTLNRELVCNQMLLHKPITIEINQQIVELQTLTHKKDLFDLVNRVQPGYFRDHTSELGRYYGIYINDELIAVTGERMKMNAFTEISAVVTHPDHIGKGYAKQLITHASNLIFLENKIPYLHVAETNVGAIKLYEKLGFKTRRKISFWNLTKVE
jgi:GNAT superfamily N-acetyltransferase